MIDEERGWISCQVWNRPEIIERYLPYMEARLREGTRLHDMTRHILGLFATQPGARRWRRYISENAHRPGAGIDVVRNALGHVRI